MFIKNYSYYLNLVFYVFIIFFKKNLELFSIFFLFFLCFLCFSVLSLFFLFEKQFSKTINIQAYVFVLKKINK